MAGGVGSRFWPVSRTQHPKQFIDILGTGSTLIQQTYERLLKIMPNEHIFLVTNVLYKDLIKEQLPLLPLENILFEPIAKNTAPCIAYACYKIAAKVPNANILVCPSDHIMLKEQNFIDAINEAFNIISNNNFLITLGIQPSRPDTGYGYIQYKASDTNLKKVKTFTEKPTLEIAKTFIKSGDFLWNAGIFVWNARSIIEAFQKHLPEMHQLFLENEAAWYTDNEAEVINTTYPLCNSISIDYGIMEKADNVYVMPSDFGWSDLGTWGSLHDVAEKDYLSNVVIGTKKAIMFDSNDCMVFEQNDKKLIIIKGLQDYIVADTKDALLICPKAEEQSIKLMVAEVKSKFGDKGI